MKFVDVAISEPGGFGTNFMANMHNGADTDRLESYGPLAEMPDKLWGPFLELLTAEEAPNPQQVGVFDIAFSFDVERENDFTIC